MLSEVKTCSKCGHTGPLSDFKQGRRICVPCYKAKQKKHYNENKELYNKGASERYRSLTPKERHREKVTARFGKSDAWFDQLWSIQEQKCAICHSLEPFGIGQWSVDHDHQTEEVRGFLCNNCNLALGLFKDNTTSLRRAAEYLESPPSRRCTVNPEEPNPIPDSKQCGNCKVTKQLTEFHNSHNNRLGRTAWCKQCMRAYRRNYYLAKGT